MNSISWLFNPLDACHGPDRVFRKWFDRWRSARGRVFALSVGAGLTPEMLPMIITASLAKGSIIMQLAKISKNSMLSRT